MGQQINDNFTLLAGLPLDDRYKKNTITDRDNIEPTRRYQGLPCYVEQTDTLYLLVGGIDNSNWLAIGSADTSNPVRTFNVESYPFIWQKGDGNTEDIMQVGDIILNGFCDYDDGGGSQSTLIALAVYNTGDPSFISSYDVVLYKQTEYKINVKLVLKNIDASLTTDNLLTINNDGEVNESSVSISDLVTDDSNFAKLDANQTFTGLNTFDENIDLISNSLLSRTIKLTSVSGANNYEATIRSISGSLTITTTNTTTADSGSLQLLTDGTLRPQTNGTQDIGTLALQFRNVFANMFMAENIVIDPSGSNLPISGSILTVRNIHDTIDDLVGEFVDITRNNTSDNSGTQTFGLVSRVTNTSSNLNKGIIGSNSIGRNTGSGNMEFVYATLLEAEQEGSSNLDFLIPAVLRANITGTDTNIIDVVRSLSNNINIDNPNTTVNTAEGVSSFITLLNGSVGDVTALNLTLSGTGSTVTGDIAYIKAPNNALPTPTGNTYFIKSEVVHPSEFAGSLEATSFIKTGSTNNDVLLGDGTTVPLSGIGGIVQNTGAVTYTAANVNSGTEIQLIAAPGINKYIEVLSVTVIFEHVADFTGSGFLQILYGNSSGNWGQSHNLNTMTADENFYIRKDSFSKSTFGINEAVNIQSDVTTGGAGSSFKVYASYTIKDV